LPLPALDRARLLEIDRVEQERFVRDAESGERIESKSAQGAANTELSVGVRTVGELFRQSGALLWQGAPGVEAVLRDLRGQFQSQLGQGKLEELLALRSLQSQLFVEALSSAASAEGPSTELQELGGDLGRLLDRGWLGFEHASGGVSVPPDALRLLFRVRWGTLVGCHRQVPFGPTLEEQRAYYSLYLLHPPLAGADEVGGALERVAYARALGQVDPSYPADFAIGSLLMTAGQFEQAAAHFRAHLQRSDSGPYGLLARNHLLLALSSP